MGDLPGGAQIPIRFRPGEPLTAEGLNRVQRELLSLLLTHDHTGNEQGSPQGRLIGSKAIEKDAVKGTHISPNAVCKGDIHNATVGASELQEKCIGSNHLVDEAVGTAQIKERAVTLSRLADEVVRLLNAPREGATTYTHALYLAGQIVYPTEPGRDWHDWLLDQSAPVRMYDLPIRRLRDDGGWQPIRSIAPPDRIRFTRPTVDMATRAEMATTLAAVLKQNEAVVREALGGPLSEVKAESSRWRLTMADGRRLFLSDSKMQELLWTLSAGGADLSRTTQPLHTSSLSLTAALDGLGGSGEVSHDAAAVAAPLDPIHFLNPSLSDEIQERSRTAMLVDPGAMGWQTGQEGQTLLFPGVGGNGAFSETGQGTLFQPDREPSAEERLMITQMLHHFDIELEQRNIGDLLKIPKFYDFLNSPHLLGTGYWTGASRNVRAVAGLQEKGLPFVRIRFATPYTGTSYAVSVAPDFQAQGQGYEPITAHVFRRKAGYVDLLFLRGNQPVNKLGFSVAIYGELVES